MQIALHEKESSALLLHLCYNQIVDSHFQERTDCRLRCVIIHFRMSLYENATIFDLIPVSHMVLFIFLVLLASYKKYQITSEAVKRHYGYNMLAIFCFHPDPKFNRNESGIICNTQLNLSSGAHDHIFAKLFLIFFTCSLNRPCFLHSHHAYIYPNRGSSKSTGELCPFQAHTSI